MSLKDDKFLPGHFRAQQITQCALWGIFVSNENNYYWAACGTQL